MSVTLVRRGTAIATSVEYIDNNDMRPMHVSADGVTTYFAQGKSLYRSTNDGNTFTLIWTLPVTGTSTGIAGVLETADGFLLVTCFKLQGFYSGAWRIDPATGAATEVLTPSGQAPQVADPATFPSPMGTTGDRSNYFTPRFGFHAYPDGTVVMNEYGKQANGTSIPGARYGVVSNDNGKAGTWRVALDIFTGPAYGVGWVPGTLPFGPAGGGQHLHGFALDPFTDILWATAGDHGCHHVYSTDWRRVFNGENATWTVHPGSVQEFGGIGNVSGAQMPGTTQSIEPHAFPDRIVFTTDGQVDGITKIEKSDPNYLREAHGLYLPHTSTLRVTGARIFRRGSHLDSRSPFPVVFAQYAGSGGNVTPIPAVIVACDPNGERFYDIWTDSITGLNPYGVYGAFGPTAKGKLLASIALDGRSANQVGDSAGLTFMRADFPVLV